MRRTEQIGFDAARDPTPGFVRRPTSATTIREMFDDVELAAERLRGSASDAPEECAAGGGRGQTSGSGAYADAEGQQFKAPTTTAVQALPASAASSTHDIPPRR